MLLTCGNEMPRPCAQNDWFRVQIVHKQGSPPLVIPAAVAVLALWTCSAFAETGPVEAFRTFGLIGTWSPDCQREPAPDNPRVSWNVIDGAIIHTVTFDGRTLALVDTVSSAEIMDNDIIRFTAVRAGGFALITTLRIMNGRIRTIRSKGSDGRVYYDHAVELATGKPSLIDEHCAAVIS